MKTIHISRIGFLNKRLSQTVLTIAKANPIPTPPKASLKKNAVTCPAVTFLPSTISSTTSNKTIAEPSFKSDSPSIRVARVFEAPSSFDWIK